jgi:hypothetical protein
MLSEFHDRKDSFIAESSSPATSTITEIMFCGAIHIITYKQFALVLRAIYHRVNCPLSLQGDMKYEKKPPEKDCRNKRKFCVKKDVQGRDKFLHRVEIC